MRTTVRRTMAGIFAAAHALCLGRTARAQAVAGSWQLGLATNVVSYTRTTTTARYPPMADVNYPVVGDFDHESSATRWGLGDHGGVSLEVGYRLGPHFVLGGVVTLGGGSQSWRDESDYQHDTRTFSLFAGPKIDFMLLSGSSFRPFVSAIAGVARSTETEQLTPLFSRAGVPYPTAPATTDESSLTGVKLGGRMGIRCFAASWFSIDPALFFEMTFLEGSGPYQQSPYRQSMDPHAKGYALGLSVAASGWIGP